MGDYRRLAEFGKGTLEIDVLTRHCSHNGTEIDPLNISWVLQTWLRRDATEHHIPIEAIQRASIKVVFETERHLGQREAGSWANPTPYFVSCSMSCASIIQTDELTYTSSFSDRDEWPESYSSMPGGAA